MEYTSCGSTAPHVRADRWFFNILVAMMVLGAPVGQGAIAAMTVVATTTDLAALARAVGGKHVSVTALAPPSQDPHYVDPRPNLILPLNQARLLVLNGLDLEAGWLNPLVVNSRNNTIQAGSDGYLDVSQFVDLLQVPSIRVDRSMGDVHPGGNPHFTYDPRRMAKIAAGIAARMAAVDPPNAADYAKHGDALAQKLQQFAEAQTRRFASLPQAQRLLVTYHQSLTYLFDWLGLTNVVSIEPQPGIPPNPSHVAKVLTLMRQRGVRAIVQEEHHPRSTSKTLSKLAKVPLVVIPTAVRFSKQQSYLEHMTTISQEIFDALSR